MKKILIIAAILALLLTACSATQPASQAIGNQQSYQPTQNVPPEPVKQEANKVVIQSTQGMMQNPPPIMSNIKEFDVIAKKWEFNPSVIKVNLGDEVVLNVKSIDVEHGIAIPDFNIMQSLHPNEPVTIKFKADKKGSFSMYCNVFCGSGHKDMKGTLVVE